MKVDLGIWSKLTPPLVVFVLFVAGLLLVGVKYLPLIQQNERMRKEILRFDAQIQRQEDLARQLKTSIDSLQHDPRAVERLARERLGYAKPGETIFRFETPATNTTTPRM
jgi:cell division protein FtsB